MREKKNKESIINVRDLIFVFYILYSRLISGGSTEVDDFTEMLRLMDVKFADEEDEGHADGQLPDVHAQAVPPPLAVNTVSCFSFSIFFFQFLNFEIKY